MLTSKGYITGVCSPEQQRCLEGNRNVTLVTKMYFLKTFLNPRNILLLGNIFQLTKITKRQEIHWAFVK